MDDMKHYQKTQLESSNGARDNSFTTVIGIAVGKNRWLVHMNDIGEVLPPPKLTQVSLTKPWFQGVANVHGSLYGIVDLSLYLSGTPTVSNLKNRVLLASLRFGVNTGLLVNNMLGIRSLSDFELVESVNVDAESSIIEHYQDKDGKLWQGLNVRELVCEQNFLRIAV